MTSPASRHAARFVPAVPLLVLAVIAACGTAAPAADPGASAPVSVRPEDVIVVQADSLTAGPLLSGSLIPDRQATLRAEVPGTVLEVRVEPGEAVGAGQLLIRLDDAALADAAASARAAVRTAREAALVAQRNLERNTRLAAAGAIAERDREQAMVAAMNAEAGLADATARLTAAEKQLAKARLAAPFRGVVSERPVRAGDVVQNGTPLVTVVDPTVLRLEATVPVAALGTIRVGTPVHFQVTGAGGGRFAGTVRRINPVVDPGTGQVRITVLVPNRDGRLVGGLFASGVAAATSRTGLAVPVSAIDLRGVTPGVRIIRGGVVTAVGVETGLRDEARELIEITAGLAAGDTVLVGGATGLATGTRVVVTRE